MNSRYGLVAERARHRCEYCRAPEVIFNFPFEVEHIVPPKRGGSARDDNLALSCRACNLHKAKHVEAKDPETAETCRLFHPRQNVWNEHFRADSHSGSITGLTAAGRATVYRLKMNAPTQLAARRAWARLGLFP